MTRSPLKSLLVQIVYPFIFPLYSLLSRDFGFTVFFPGRGGWWAWTRGTAFRVPEPGRWTLAYFRRFVPRRGGIVFDVGGEKGFETTQFSRMVGSRGHVFVFECMPDHIAHLRRLAARLGNVTLIERACWNIASTLRLFPGLTAGSSTVILDAKGDHGQELADRNRTSISAEAERLDDLWRQHANGAPIDFLKMDIEGAEYEALEGATELLQHTRSAVIAAYHIRDGVPTSTRVADMLRAAGFDVEVARNHHVYASRRL